MLYIYFQHRTKKSCELYEPIVHLIKSSGIESMKTLIQLSQLNQVETSKKNQPSKLENKSLSSGFRVKYCGSVHVGTEGDVKQIEKAIWHLLKSGEVKQVPVRFECLEIGIKVIQERDNVVSVSDRNNNTLKIIICSIYNNYKVHDLRNKM